MSKTKTNVSFKTGDAEVAEVDTAVVEEMEQEITPYVPREFPVLSEFGLELPPIQLKIAYGVGIGVEMGYTTGSLFLQRGTGDDAHCVQLMIPPTRTNAENNPLPGPVDVVLLQGVRFWREYLKGPFVPGVFAREFDLVPGNPDQIPPEASEAGLRTTWLNDPNLPATERGPTLAKAMELFFFVKKPEGVEDDMFMLQLGDGNWYAPARFLADKGIYRSLNGSINYLQLMSAQMQGVPLQDARLDTHLMELRTAARNRSGTQFVDVSLTLQKKVVDGKHVAIDQKSFMAPLALLTAPSESQELLEESN